MRGLALMMGLSVGCAGYGGAYQAAERIAESRCEQAFTCEASYPADAESSHEQRYGTDTADCVARLGPDPALRDRWDNAEEAGDLSFDKAAAKSCASGIAGMGCETFWAEPPPDSCETAVVGTLGLDQACRIDAVCASGLCQDGLCAGNPE